MKQWKRMGICMIAAVLSASGPGITAWAGSPEFARTPEVWAKLRDNVMEYDELADLIHEYNVTVQKNQLDINDKKKDDLITSDDYAQQYRDAAFDTRNNISGDNPIADAQSAVSAKQADEMADKNVQDLTVYQLTHQQEEANLVASAQSLMISYFQKSYELESAKNSLELQQAVYQATLAKQTAGMATQIDVLGAQESMQNTQTSMDKLKSSIEETKQKLCVMLGWKYNASPEIRQVPDVDMARLESMNPDTDKETALNNNYTLKINKQKRKNATADLTIQTLNRTIASNEQNINTDVVKEYQAALQAKAAYEQAVAEDTLESKNKDAAELGLQVGSISPLDHKKQQNAYITKSIAVKTAELDLLQAVQTYENAVNGLASTGG